MMCLTGVFFGLLVVLLGLVGLAIWVCITNGRQG